MSGRSRNTTIPDGTTETTFTERRGDRIRVEKGDAVEVDGAPAVVLDDDRSSLRNEGRIETSGATQTVRVDADRVLVDNRSRGTILAEETAVEVTGERAFVLNRGLVEGDLNGVSFANGGESSGTLLNTGAIRSDSRAVNIGGEDIAVINRGEILGTGDQRNGTIYSDGSADRYAILNTRSGSIDAGEHNQGAGIALQTGDVDGDRVRASLVNQGEIDGRGQAAPNVGLAGDGVRIFSGVPDASDGVTFAGNLVNSGRISSESTQGPTAGVRVANGAGFEGTIANLRGGVIEGAGNGLYFGTGEHDARVLNDGTIRSDSRAVNIDGTGVDLTNRGEILGTGDQRNGTIYADGTADDYRIENTRRGDVDAGEGNQGAGIALQTGDVNGDRVEASIVNRGEIDGRGQAAANLGLAGDGIRVFSGVPGAADGVTFAGDIVNSGRISSESAQGTTAGVRIANGVGFEGTVANQRGGLIEGEQNGLYFGTGDHDARVLNDGTIQSGSRAVNIDGTGIELINRGKILGTGDQRNGTIYADGTADEYSVLNTRRGVIDAGEGNDGAGISLQTGDVNADVVNASVRNDGRIVGRGDGEGNLEGDGIRVFSGVADAADGVTFQGDIVNRGRIYASEDGVDVRSGVTIDGDLVNSGRIVAEDAGLEVTGAVEGNIVNRGVISGERAGIDASQAEAPVEVRNSGRIEGDVSLSAGNDVFINEGHGRVEGSVFGGAGNDRLEGGRDADALFGGAGADVLRGGRGDDFLQGGRGSDVTDGGSGSDTASFADIGTSVTANLAEGTAVYLSPGGATIVDQLISIENLVGSSNDDVLAGDRGNNVLTGGEGSDTFVFEEHAGRDTVTDFQVGVDELSVGDFFDSSEQALEASRQSGSNTIVDLGSGDQVKLVGVQVSDLDAGDFIV